MAQLVYFGLLCSSGVLALNQNNNNYYNRYDNYESFENRQPSWNNNNNINNNQQNFIQPNYYQPAQQRIPNSRCSYFEYVTNNNGETQGRISFQTPQDANIDLRIELSLRARLSVSQKTKSTFLINGYIVF